MNSTMGEFCLCIGLRIIIMSLQWITGHQNPPLPKVSGNLHPIFKFLQWKVLNLYPCRVGSYQVLHGGGQVRPHFQALLPHLLVLPGVLCTEVHKNRVFFRDQSDSSTTNQPKKKISLKNCCKEKPSK